MQFLQFVWLVSLFSSALSEHVFFVKPADSESNCPGQPCLMLEQYTSQGKQYFPTGSTFLFLAGDHSINTTISLQGVSNMTFKGKENESDVTIVCKTSQFIVLINATNITLQGITFQLYKDGIPAGDTYSALVITDCQKIKFHNLTFHGTADLKSLVRAAYFIRSNVELVSCFFRGNAGYFGGAILAEYGSNITLDGNIFFNNVAKHSGGAVFVNKSALILKETMGNTFSHNLALRGGGALLILESRIIVEGANDSFTKEADINCLNFSKEQDQHGPVLITHRHTTYFLNNEARALYGGGGALRILKYSTAQLSGSCIIFYNNSAAYNGGAFHSANSSVKLNAMQSYFTMNRAAINGGAFHGAYSILNISEFVYFRGNFAGGDGGAFCSLNSTSHLTGRIYLFNNHAAMNGGAMAFVTSTTAYICGPIIDFVANTAANGGGLHVEYSKLEFGRSCEVRFTKNTAKRGAVRAYNGSITFNGSAMITKNVGGGINAAQLSLIAFAGKTMFEENNAVEDGGGAIAVSYGTTLSISGNMILINNTAIGLNGGAILASDSSTSIVFHDNVTFISNRAENGGALSFENGAIMILKHNSILTTSYNHATINGGAIYHGDAITPSQCKFAMSVTSSYKKAMLSSCFLQLSHPLINLQHPHQLYSIISEYDSSGIDGSFLYGGLLDKCQAAIYTINGANSSTIQEILYSVLTKYNILNVTSKFSRHISSEAYELCFCENNQDFNCSEIKSIQAYRGRKFTVSVVALAQGDTATSVLLRAKLNATARLKQDQILQTHPQMCSEVSYNMYSSKEQEQLVLYPDGGTCHDIGMARAVINVTFLPCPNGFTLSGDECICEERLQKYKPECIIYDDKIIFVKANSKFWANGSYSPNGTYQGLILCQTCPIEYCKTQPVNISLDQPDVQCDHNRSGLLCGACAANHSLMLGSSNCQKCSDVYLTLLIPFAVAGIALVVFLSALRLTVASGLINSIILYANILQANRSVLYPSSTGTTNVLTVFIAWMNLDLGFQTCFYHELDAFAQTWLQYAFPIYVWFIIIFIILASRYSVIITKLIGSNPIAVLATLLLLSYSKLLKITIEVYSLVKLDYPNSKTVTVWLKDANEPYLQSRHLVLTIITTLFFAFLFLPYTFLLLLGYKLYSLSGRKYFHWLNRIKPLLDSYYAPYKIHTRYWTGFLLLVRCVLYFVFSFNSLGATTKSLLTINIAFTSLLALLSVRIYTNFCINVVEVFVYLNLISLSAADLAGFNSPFVANSLVGIVFLIMVGIIVYHFLVVYIIAKSTSLLKMLASFTEQIKNHVVNETTPLIPPIVDTSAEMPVVTSSIVSLQEPLHT